MLSDNTEDLARLLRSHIGEDRVGVGPDIGRLVELWGDKDPAALRPAIDELESVEFLRVDRGIPAHPSGVGSEFGVRGIAGVATTEALQNYLDNSA